MTTTEPLVKYSVRTNDLYDEHVLQGGEIVYKAEDVERMIKDKHAFYVRARLESEREVKQGKAQQADVTHISAMIEVCEDILAQLGRNEVGDE